MFDNFVAYYHENVVDSYVTCCATSTDGKAGRSRDLKTCLVSANALFHLREHLPQNSALTRAEVEKLCPDYALLGDVVNASKHKELSGATPHGMPLIQKANDIYERITSLQYEDSKGPYNHHFKEVIATLTDGSERELLDILTAVLNFWEFYLHSTGHLKEARTFKREPTIKPRTREECQASALCFEVVQGQRFLQHMRFLRHDDSSGNAEPLDLSGCKVSAGIYQRTSIADVNLTHNLTGEQINVSVELTPEESDCLSGIQDESERHECLMALPSVVSAIRAALSKEEQVKGEGGT